MLIVINMSPNMKISLALKATIPEYATLEVQLSFYCASCMPPRNHMVLCVEGQESDVLGQVRPKALIW